MQQVRQRFTKTIQEHIDQELGPMPSISIPPKAGFAGTDPNDQVILVAINLHQESGRIQGINNHVMSGNHSRMEITRIVTYDEYERNEQIYQLFRQKVGPRTKDVSYRPSGRLSALMAYSVPAAPSIQEQANNWALATGSILRAVEWAARAIELAADGRQYGLIIGCTMDVPTVQQPKAMNFKAFNETNIRGIYSATLVELGKANIIRVQAEPEAADAFEYDEPEAVITAPPTTTQMPWEEPGSDLPWDEDDALTNA